MDTSRPMGNMPAKPEVVQEPRASASAEAVAEQLLDLQRTAVVNLITEIIETADIVGVTTHGETLYLMTLSPANADTLAALFADMEGDPLDAGEDEHDGSEPDPEDAG